MISRDSLLAGGVGIGLDVQFPEELAPVEFVLGTARLLRGELPAVVAAVGVDYRDVDGVFESHQRPD